MAENEREVREDQANGNDTDDLATLKARLADTEKKLGTLVNERKKIAEDRNNLSTRLKVWNDLAEEHGLEPEQLKALLSARDEEDLAKARDKGEIDKLLENQRKKYEREIEASKDETAKLSKTIEALTIDATLDVELDKIVEPRLKRGAFALHRGKVKIIADPEAAHGIRTVVEVDDNYMSVGDYLKQWAENDPDADGYLKVSQAGGGGAAQGGGNPRLRFKSRKAMTPLEKSQFIRANGVAEYNKLPWDKQ